MSRVLAEWISAAQSGAEHYRVQSRVYQRSISLSVCACSPLASTSLVRTRRSGKPREKRSGQLQESVVVAGSEEILCCAPGPAFEAESPVDQMEFWRYAELFLMSSFVWWFPFPVRV